MLIVKWCLVRRKIIDADGRPRRFLCLSNQLGLGGIDDPLLQRLVHCIGLARDRNLTLARAFDLTPALEQGINRNPRE